MSLMEWNLIFHLSDMNWKGVTANTAREPSNFISTKVFNKYSGQISTSPSLQLAKNRQE